MPFQELILSTTSLTPPLPTSTTSTSNPKRKTFAPITSTPTIQAAGPSTLTLHDLQTSTPIHTYKSTNSSLNCLATVPTSNQIGGGTVWAIQEGKGIANVWAWSKDQLHMKIHLPERLTCFSISPNGIWASGGTSTGHIYLWEIASGLMLSSFDAAYRKISILKWSQCSQVLISGSEDSSITVWSVARLVDDSLASTLPTPFATLGDHSLGITDIQVGKGKFPECRVFSSSLDGTVKQYSLSPPSLLTTFKLPPSQTPTCLTLDPLERSFHVGTHQGEIYQVRLYRPRRGEEINSTSKSDGEGGMIAIGGGGPGDIQKIESNTNSTSSAKGQISLPTTDGSITTITLSLSQTHLLTGTSSGIIHIHSLPSHQHLRSILTHQGSPISYIGTMLKPVDLVNPASKFQSQSSSGGGGGIGGAGGGNKGGLPIMEIKTLERMRVGKKEREEHEVGMMLRPMSSKKMDELLGGLDIIRSSKVEVLSSTSSGESGQVVGNGNGSKDTSNGESSEEQILDLKSQVEKLQAQLKRAKEINEKIWAGVVDKTLASEEGQGDKKKRKVGGGGTGKDVDMD